jgi:hypothetical protein
MNPVDQYLVEQELTKEAGAGEWIAKNPTSATIAAGVATPLVLMAGQEGYQEVKGMVGRYRGYRRMMDFNPKLKKVDAKQTKALFNTLHNAAPDLARDPVVASSFVSQMAHRDEYVDPRTLADLGSAQKNISRRGLDVPVGQITQSIMGAVGGTAEQARRAEEMGLKRKQWEHQQARDAVSMAKDKAQRAQALVKIKGDVQRSKSEKAVGRVRPQEGSGSALSAAHAAFKKP